jgi:hypothetical protein
MAKPEIQTGVLAESEYPAWNALIGAASTGSIYARPEYLDALCTATGGRYRILAAKQGELLLGGVGLYELDSAFGTFVSPRLLLYYNGPVLRQHESKYPSEQTARNLKTLVALESALRQAGHGSVLLKPRSTLVDLRPLLARGWTARHGYSYVVPISDLEQARARVEQNLRRLIDRCGRAETAFTEDDDFDSFFRLHGLTMGRVDFRVYLPERAFRTFYETLARQGLARLYHARLPDGRAIASQLVLLGHSVTHTVSAGADPEHLKSGVTAFLRWKVFERLSALGFSANDLTDASLNAVTHFKSQLGGSLEPVVELRMPETVRFRWGARATRLAARSRGAAGMLRRALRRDTGTPE